MYLCREIISTPLKSIGKCLGNRDHTTIMHASTKLKKKSTTMKTLKTPLKLKEKINPQG
ncbi:MAG: helix-turn-helix domain-containing protein [Streptococcus sp.]